MTAHILVVDGVCAGYGGGDIIKGASFSVANGEIATIVGPNGAGKSTLIKSLVGLLTPRQGHITLAGREVTHLDAPSKARSGLGYVPQEYNVFNNMTIGENLTLGYEFIAGDSSGMAEALDRVFAIFPDLKNRTGDLAGNLSGGQRQMLAFGCALMPGPEVLLLDEPSAGLSPKYVAEMFEAVKAVNEANVSILMIEQNVKEAMLISATAIVLVNGTIRATMGADTFMAHPDIHSLYLGTDGAQQEEQ